MSESTIIFFLVLCVILLIAIIMYQQVIFRRGIQSSLNQIGKKIKDILDNDTDEKIMIFTDNRILADLVEQVNRLLLNRQKIKANYKKSEISSKRMLSNISHDIKTPLTVILGYLEMIRLSSVEDETLIKVERKANQVMDLINQFFILAKLEAGDTNIDISKISINEICKENILDFYDILTQKEFQVDIMIPSEEIYVYGNKDALNRIFFNLLSNAVKYGSEGKYLGFTLRQDKENIYIDVVDKGKGIERQFASNVFERLYTMEDSRNREIQGNGLGLTIARNLSVKLGGDIYLESIPYVKTTFTVMIKGDSKLK